MSKVFAVGKAGVDVLTETDPNEFIYHSDYNTFKIITEDTESITVSANANKEVHSVAHGLSFTPLVSAFAKESTRDGVFLPNSDNYYYINFIAPMNSTGLRFNYVQSDATNIYFVFTESNGTARTVTVKYYCLEEV